MYKDLLSTQKVWQEKVLAITDKNLTSYFNNSITANNVASLWYNQTEKFWKLSFASCRRLATKRIESRKPQRLILRDQTYRLLFPVQKPIIPNLLNQTHRNSQSKNADNLLRLNLILPNNPSILKKPKKQHFPIWKI